MVEKFIKYVDGFDTSDNAILLKKEHTLRVLKLCRDIASDLDANEDIASNIGILHDYARFIQWKTFKSFVDRDTFDHALVGAQKLFDDDEISYFDINKDTYEYVAFAVKNHNKYEVEYTSDKEKEMFSKIIRDADKIDILNIYSTKANINRSINTIDKNVLSQFYNHNSILLNKDINPSEAHLVRLAFIYDLNYKISYEYIKEILQRYKENLNNTYYDEYFNEVNKYIEKRKNYVRK